MGKKSKRVRVKQTKEENEKAKKVVVSAVKQAVLLGCLYTTNKQKKGLQAALNKQRVIGNSRSSQDIITTLSSWVMERLIYTK